MFSTRLRLFRLLGVPVSLDASWLIVLALLTLTFAGGFPALLAEYYPEATPALTPYQYWAMGLSAALVFFACIVLHELGHAAVARARGMRIRGITLFLFGGVAEIEDEPPSAMAEFLMAVAGPAVSAVLAGALGLSARLGYRAGWPPPVVVVLGDLAAANAFVLAFNLVPAFPLDGGRVLRAALWAALGDLRRATYRAAQAGQAFAWVLITFGLLQFFAGNWLGGVWLGLIGLFLNTAARGGYEQVVVRQALQGEPVRHFMTATPVTVPPSLDLRRWVDDYVYRYHRKAFPVIADGRLEGYIEAAALARIPAGEWGEHTVGAVMRRDLTAVSIAPDADALEALGKMQRAGSSRLLVVEGDRLVGIISLKDLLGFLALKLELEGEAGGGPGSAVDDAPEAIADGNGSSLREEVGRWTHSPATISRN